jgi:hypothetical protein
LIRRGATIRPGKDLYGLKAASTGPTLSSHTEMVKLGIMALIYFLNIDYISWGNLAKQFNPSET